MKHPKMFWNTWYHYLKWREMLYLTISWCYDSKKILWIRSVSKYPVNVCQGARQPNYLSVNVFAFLEREISSIYYFLSYKDSPPNNFLLLKFFIPNCIVHNVPLLDNEGTIFQMKTFEAHHIFICKRICSHRVFF